MLLLPTALFVVLSSTPAYRFTSALGLQTHRYGQPTPLGVVVHAAIFALLLALVS
jgi:hypothetical protein